MAEHKDLTESYIEVTSHDFAEQVLNASQMVVVDFYQSAAAHASYLSRSLRRSARNTGGV